MLIALSGKMYSGKSTVADFLIRNHKFHRLSFAGALKEDIMEMGFSAQDVLNKPPWMRELLQAYGKARRAADPGYWVKRLRVKLDDPEFTADRVVIDDMRFPNEAQFLAGRGAYLVRLQRLGFERGELPGWDDESETALDGWANWSRIIAAASNDLPLLNQGATELMRDVQQIEDHNNPWAV